MNETLMKLTVSMTDARTMIDHIRHPTNTDVIYCSNISINQSCLISMDICSFLTAQMILYTKYGVINVLSFGSTK
jgi:hypothetical protein